MRISVAQIRNTIACGCVCVAGLAHAQDGISLSRAAYIEQVNPAHDTMIRSLSHNDQLRSGDKVILLVEWNAPQNGKAFTLSSRIPSGLIYQRSSDDSVEISTDGGSSWGRLGTLRAGSRLATPEDATHLRWRISAARAASRTGRIAYRAIVRR